MWKIKKLSSNYYEDFWEGITVTFKPIYEIKDKNAFVEFATKETKEGKAIYFGIFNNNGPLIGGFRATKTITYFFLNERGDQEDKIVEQVLNTISTQNKMGVFTKQRYTDLFLKNGFKIKYQRYSMILKPLHQISNIKVPEGYEVKPFDKGDLSSIADILINAYENTLDEGIFGKSSKEETINSLREIIAEKDKDFMFLGDHSFLAYFKEEIIGVVLITLFRQIPLVYDMAVKKKHQGKGVGKALLQVAISSLSKDYSELILFVTRGNEHAERLYKSLGFKQLSEDLVALVKFQDKPA